MSARTAVRQREEGGVGCWQQRRQATTRIGRALGLALGCLWLASPIAAAPLVCPAMDGCRVTAGDSSIRVTSPVLLGPSLLEWSVGGIEQLALQAIWVYDFGPARFRRLDPVSATFDEATNEIVVAFSEDTGTFDLTATYLLSDSNDGATTTSIVDGNFELFSNVAGLSIRFYLVTDFDLSDTPGDDSAVFTGPATIDQSDSSSSAQQVILSPTANAWEIGSNSGLTFALDEGTLINLGNSGSGSGPTDIEFGFMWDRTLEMGETFTIDLESTVVPEGEASLLQGFALFALLAARASRNRREHCVTEE